MNVREEVKKMKQSVPLMAASDLSVRNDCLGLIAQKLEENRDKIFAANKKDMERAEQNNIAPAVMKRLKYNEAKLRDSIAGLTGLIWLDDPVGKVLLKRQLDEDLILTRISVPIGVIGVIFEARPDALIQVASLCIKSGNCAVLKGGKETLETNRVLFEIIKDCAKESGLPEGCLLQVEAHSEIDELLKCDTEVDLLIPRGSNAFVRYIMEHTKIPVMGHSSGICHTYVDDEFDMELAKRVVVDAKIQYPAACNATETLLLNEGIDKSDMAAILTALKDAGVKIRADQNVVSHLAGEFDDIELMEEDEYGTEYGDNIISVAIVKDTDEAIRHINCHGSHHTDCMITTNDSEWKHFAAMVDSAGVYRNCSTRFADGFRYGFGAEVGISTGKIHARGPVGLEGLVTYKYTLEGVGQTVDDYATGRKEFHHKDI